MYAVHNSMLIRGTAQGYYFAAEPQGFETHSPKRPTIPSDDRLRPLWKHDNQNDEDSNKILWRLLGFLLCLASAAMSAAIAWVVSSAIL